jgi:hypothetical protein
MGAEPFSGIPQEYLITDRRGFMLSFHHERADLHFSWDGWMQIRVRRGEFAPLWGFPDRFDIGEPDLHDPSRHPMYPADGSVHLVPYTQEAFEALCDTWWRGGEICVGLRDYARDPWEMRSWGLTQGAFRYRYAGGSHIEAAPADTGPWRPLIELAADGRTPSSLSTVWLIERVNGWEKAWLAVHGIVNDGDGLDRAIGRWTIAHLPAPGRKGSLAGQFGTWIYRQAAAELTGRAWEQRRNLGEYAPPVTRWRPWSTTRDAADGTRWNFWWCGDPYAYVYSPDRRLNTEQTHFALHPDEVADGPVTEWLQRRADAWLLDIERP